MAIAGKATNTKNQTLSQEHSNRVFPDLDLVAGEKKRSRLEWNKFETRLGFFIVDADPTTSNDW